MSNFKCQMLNFKKTNSILIVCYLAFIIGHLAFPAVPRVRAQENATDSPVRDLVREKVKETLQTLAKDPRAVMGTLAQPSNNGFEIKTQDNMTRLVSTNSDTKYYQVTKGVKKEVKAEDLAVGAFVVSLGYQNQDVLSAQRVIGYDQSPLTFKKQIYFGKVTSLGKNTVTVKSLKTSQEQTFKITSKTDITVSNQDKTEELKFSDIKSDIKDGNSVVVVATTDDKNNTQVLRVHLVKNVQPTPSSTLAPTESKPTAKPSPTPTKKPTPTLAEPTP